MMNILDANIGSAKDNMSSPVHNWYKFTAGFSYKFVDIIRGQDIVVYELPVQAVTETIVNAVVHRDYLSTGSVQVMLFKDRLEVWNPGRLRAMISGMAN